MRKMFRCLCLSLFIPILVQAAPNDDRPRPQLDVVFVLDTTSSMGGLIEGAKQKIWSIASRMASGKPTPRIRVGLVAFRDRGDEYVTRRFDLTDDLDAVYKNLRAFSAEGGGDTPEHVGQGLGEAVKLMHWSDSNRTAKMIFLVGDAPAHDDYQDEFNLSKMAKLAIAHGIVVNTIRCGEDAATEAAFREVARLADGSFISIGQEGGMVAVATPYDDALAKLNGELAAKSVFAGSSRARAAGEAEKKEVAAMDSTSAADRISYRSKAGAPAGAPAAVAAYGGVDLVADPSKLDGMRDEDLPEQLRALSPAARKEFLNKLRAEKESLESKVVALTKDRDGWMASKVAKKSDAFDDTVMAKVAESARRVGISY
jgi:Mg-chelatase subunit ChlD